MGRIRQLSKHLINQIAAGEVIERPASVVKELLENSIDANASKVTIEITNDCRNIRIADNGCGIHPDDIMLAFSKHATSKLKTDEDLYDINTLGFRGEALSSIISIAKVTCITRTSDFDYGTKVVCENSQVEQSQTGCAIGTIMDIKDLFYNVPVRLKFLKNSNTEFSYIQEVVQSIALAHPEVAVELKKFGKTVLNTSAQNNLMQTVKEIYSKDVSNYLKEVAKTDKLSNLKISGYVSTPDYTRSSKKSYHTFINSRSVKCPIFQKAIDMVYKNLTANNKYPLIILNLEIPTSDVDVNVHPTKKEVRYKNPNQIFNFIYTSVEAGLSNYKEKFEEKTFNVVSKPEILNVTPIKNKFSNEEVFVDSDTDSMFIKFDEHENTDNEDVVEQKTIFLDTKIENEAELLSKDKIIGQYADTYILIDSEDGLEIVDQHIAQERYIYEKLKQEKKVISQLLFVSDVIELAVSEVSLIKDNIDKFEKFGYGIEFLNDKEIIFRKVPQMLSKTNPKEIISDILENIEGNIDNLEEKILITTSCKASVKANTKLTIWQMEEIIKQWRTTKMPYTCPHGRTISKIIPHKEIAGFFQRSK